MQKLSREEVAGKVKEILIDKLSVPSSLVEDEKQHLLNDLGADSLDSVELIMEFEKEFGIVISDDVAGKISTIKDCIETVLNILK